MAQLDTHTKLEAELFYFERFIIEIAAPTAAFSPLIAGDNKNNAFFTLQVINTDNVANTLTINDVVLEHADADLVFTTVPDELLLGQEGLTAMLGAYPGDARTITIKVAYFGTKQFVRLKITRQYDVPVPFSGTMAIFSHVTYRPYNQKEMT